MNISLSQRIWHFVDLIVGSLVDSDEGFVEMPFVTGLLPSLAQPVGVWPPELGAPPLDCLVTRHDAAFEHHLLDFTELSGDRK